MWKGKRTIKANGTRLNGWVGTRHILCLLKFSGVLRGHSLIINITGRRYSVNTCKAISVVSQSGHVKAAVVFALAPTGCLSQCALRYTIVRRSNLLKHALNVVVVLYTICHKRGRDLKQNRGTLQVPLSTVRVPNVAVISSHRCSTLPLRAHHPCTEVWGVQQR